MFALADCSSRTNSYCTPYILFLFSFIFLISLTPNPERFFFNAVDVGGFSFICLLYSLNNSAVITRHCDADSSTSQNHCLVLQKHTGAYSKYSGIFLFGDRAFKNVDGKNIACVCVCVYCICV